MFKHTEMELAEDQEVDPVAQGVAAGLEVGLRIEVGLAAAGMHAVLGNDRAIPRVAGANTQAG